MRYSRREFLQVSAGVTAGAVLAACQPTGTGGGATAGPTTAGGATGSPAPAGGTINFLTWSDHWSQDQLAGVKETTGIDASIQELADNSDGFLKLKQVGGQLDLVSGDALWVPKYHEEGLIEPIDLGTFEVATQLYPIAREFEFFTSDQGYLGYPFGWSPIQVVFNPAEVDPAPDSWDVLIDAKYKGRVVMENQPVDIMLMVGRAIGAKDGYNMTDDELEEAKDWLRGLKPNLLKLVQQNTETIAALADGSAWIATQNLGAPDRVKEAGGPEVVAFVPKEGTIGFIDAEMTVKEGENKSLVKPYLEAAEQAEWIAQNFLDYGRPLFNERAYQLLVDGGNKERADRYLYNQPELSLEMTLKGPGGRVQDYIDAFNEIILG